MKSRLNWVVAFMPEAKVIIEEFGLKRIEGKSAHFPTFESDSGEVGLVLSGMGKVQAAAATMSCLESSEGKPAATGWINFGIGGCSERRFGEAVLASKITDEGTGRSWYPVPTWKKQKDLPRLPLTTVDRPVEDTSMVKGIVEMEASGFYPVALKGSSTELTHVIKVVSDDPDHSFHDLDKGKVEELCRGAWAAVRDWGEAFREVVEQEAMRLADPPGYADWIARHRFTVTQQHQLRRLLQDWAALVPGSLPAAVDDVHPKQALQALRRELANVRVEKNQA